MNKEEHPFFTKQQMRVIHKIVTLIAQGNEQEAERLKRMLLNDIMAKMPDDQAMLDKGEQQRIYQETLQKAIEKGTLA